MSHQETSYQRWMRQQGVPVHTGYGVSEIQSLELGAWQRLGARGAFVQLVGMEGLTGMYVAEVPPGGSLAPEKHLYEELVYVLAGHATVAVSEAPGAEATFFECRAGSLFALPLNTVHRLHNVSGIEPLRFLAATTAPMVFDIFQDPDFVFGCDYRFQQRYGASADFFREGTTRWVDNLPSVWETNFIADVRTATLNLQGSADLGKHSTAYEMGGNVLAGHMEDWPPGLHDKAHYHGGGAIIVILRGEGYTLMWPQEATMQPYSSGHADQVVRIDWREGSVVSPPTRWFHQHFNTGRERMRFLAFHFGHYVPHHAGVGFWDIDPPGGHLVSTRKGGTQIDYEDEDPVITREFREAVETYLEPGRAAVRP
jgi:oxalate decarboxylase/phosphoglucose isomerase-like protein (cupin superfamily)